MAEATGLRNNALPYPVYSLPWGIVVPLLDADGDPVTGATTPDSEISKNGDTFADCTNEMVEIASGSGIYYLLLTGTEMTADVVTLQFKSATAGMKTTVAVLYPRKLVTIRSGTGASGGASTSTIVLDASAAAVDDFYNGMIVDSNNDGTHEVRMITDYTGSTQTATVTPDWNLAPDNNDAFVIYLPDGVQLQQANVSHWNSLATVALPLVPTTAGRSLDVSAGGEAGVDWANVGSPTTTLALTGTTIAVTQKVDVDTIKTNPVVNGGTITFPTTATLASTTNITAGTVTTATNVTTVNGLAANVITATAINADAITAAKIADNAIDRATFAADTGLQSIRSSTATAGGATSITLDASSSATNDLYKGALIYLTGGTGAGQFRLCTTYVGATKVATVTPAWATNPDNTSTFAIEAAGIADVEAWSGTAVATPDTAGYPKVTIKDGTGTGEIDTTNGGVLVSTLATQAKADVNAEVVDAINVDTYAEPGQGAPAATLSLVAKVNYLFKAWRNKHTQTSTTYSLFADDTTTVDQKATVSDDGTTFTRGEVATGP